MEAVAADADRLLEISGEAYPDLKEYQLLERVVREQIEAAEDGRRLRAKKRSARTVCKILRVRVLAAVSLSVVFAFFRGVKQLIAINRFMFVPHQSSQLIFSA